MQDPESRERVIEAMIEHMVGLFRPEKAKGVDAVIHIKLWDKPGGGYEHFEMVIADGECRLAKKPPERARPDAEGAADRPAQARHRRDRRPAPRLSRAASERSATSASA